MNEMRHALRSITGRYAYIGNPRTANPCVPGMAYAVQVNSVCYYITVNDRLLSENRSWGDYTPLPNDVVILSGRVSEKKDVFDKPYYTVETLTLRKAR
jgi:hypothetical protein